MISLKADEKKRYQLYLVLTSLIVVVVCTLNIGKLSSPYFVPDEMGYWTAGAWLNGLDWSEVMSTGGYYAFGYGIILAGLFLLGDSLLMYWAAVLLNVLMLLLCYYLMLQICERLFADVSRMKILLICFVTTLYSFHIVYAQLTQAEVFLTFLFLLSARILLWICERPGVLNTALFATSIGVMFASHMRTLVMIVSASICMLYMAVKRKLRIRHILSYVLTMGVILVAALMIKNRLIAAEYTASTGTVLTHNDFSGRTWVIWKILSIDGIKRLVLNFFSRFFYLGCATFFTFYYGLFSIGESIFEWIKKKLAYSKEIVIRLYLILSCLAGIAMGSAALILPSRTDHVEYGRYYENLIALVIVIGIHRLLTCEKNKINFIVMTAIHLILCFLTFEVFRMNPDLTAPLLLENAGIVGLYSLYNIQDPYFFTVVVGCVSIAIAYLLYYIAVRGKSALKNLSAIGLAIIWIALSWEALDSNVYSKAGYYASIREAAQEAENTEENIYYLLPDEEEGGKFYDVYNLQFDLCEKSLKTVRQDELAGTDWQQGDLLFLHKEIGMIQELTEKFEITFENSKFYVLEYR